MVEVDTVPVVTETVPPLARIPAAPVETLPTTRVLVLVLVVAVRRPPPVAVMLPAVIEMLPVWLLASIAVLVGPVVVMLPVRSVRLVPPLDSTPKALVPLVVILPTVTVADWPAVLSVRPLAETPPVVLMFTGALVPEGVKVSGPPVDVSVTAGTPVVAIGPLAV